MSLGARIILVTITSAVIAVFVAGLVGYPLIRDAAEQEQFLNLEQLVDATAAAIEERTPGSVALIPWRLQALLSAGQTTLYLTAPNQAMPPFIGASAAAELRAGHPVGGRVETVTGTGTGTIIFAGRLLSNGTVVILTQPEDPMRGIMGRAVSRLLLALLAGVAIAALIGGFLARRFTEPLRSAAAAAERLGEGDRDVPLALGGPREIAEVNQALAELQRALATSEGRLREFLTSVSHELRTPLTTIRGYAEALADAVLSDEANVRRVGRVMVEESDRLDRLVVDLLDLARLDADAFVIEPEAVDFADIATRAAEVWRDRCRDEGLTFQAEIPDQPIEGSTDATRVRQILDNLLANALRVTPAGLPVVLAVRGVGDAVELEVRDGGPGLTPDDCDVAFQPAELYSRYRGIRRVGTGVGLALVGRLAARLGGTAVAGPAPEGGAAFKVTIARTLKVPGRSLAQ